jgi:hypothetical protein
LYNSPIDVIKWEYIQNEYVLTFFNKFDMSKIGILYGRTKWSEEPEGGVYEKDKEGYFTDNKYEGEIKDGEPNGNGIWTQCDGATYVGQFVNGLREGTGTFTWADRGDELESVYQGEYKNNRRHGLGKRTYGNGSIQEGNWIDNDFIQYDDEED